MTPIDAFWITDNDETKLNIVVNYNIQFKKDGHIINTIIPYYLSNGHTNRFRASISSHFIIIIQKIILVARLPIIKINFYLKLI